MRVYATTADLIEYAGEEVVDDDSPRLLIRASDLVDSMLIAAAYAVDDQGKPLDDAVRDALRRPLRVVEWWHGTGDPTGAGGQFTEVTLGTLRLKRADTSSAPEVAPSAVRSLTAAGLLTQPRLSPGGWIAHGVSP